MKLLGREFRLGRCEMGRGNSIAYITVGTADLFRDENIAYAQKLLNAHIPVELHLYHGVFHGDEGFGESAVGARMRRDYMDALKRALA